MTSSNPTNRRKLQRLMRQHGLTRPGVAERTGRRLATVNAWLAPPGADWGRPMPDHALELLELKLQHEPKKTPKEGR